MKLGQKPKALQILGSKMNEKHVIGNKKNQ